MTAKEKAEELCGFYEGYPIPIEYVKQCAIKCVDEILNAVTTIADKKYEYWEQVKEEINKL